MKRLTPPDKQEQKEKKSIWEKYGDGIECNAENKGALVEAVFKSLRTQDKYLFYPLVGEILNGLGFKVIVTRDGETNNRADAFIIDEINSTPIEIKSPTEVLNVNIKSVQQALENKIVLLSRNFHPTTIETSSLAIGYLYPEDRSGVHELIDDIYSTYELTIGVVGIRSLLVKLWEKEFEGKDFDFADILMLYGKFE